MDAFMVVYLVGTAVSLALAYVLIRVGVKHGTRAALREHEMWMRDGSLDRAIDAHAAKLLEREETRQLEQRAAARERS